jgi:hypothetical protein
LLHWPPLPSADWQHSWTHCCCPACQLLSSPPCDQIIFSIVKVFFLL